MSGGRWIREDNGDYQHYTDEEYGAMLVNKSVNGCRIAIFIGLCLIYYSYDICQWGNFHDLNFDLFCVGCGLATLGGLVLKTLGASTVEVFGTYLVVIIIIAIIVFVKHNDEKEEKKQEKTENVVSLFTQPNLSQVIIHSSSD
jgi:ABC-type transport system involved in multi-copper enzyme maturation permease subunit